MRWLQQAGKTASIILLIYVILSATPSLRSHDSPEYSATTFEIASSREPEPGEKIVQLQILDEASGKPIAARFSVEIGGRAFVPDHLDKGGIRFTSIHTAKKQREVALYSRGSGRVRFPVPEDTSTLTLHVTRGYEILPVSVKTAPGEVEVRLQRWIDLSSEGWHAADTHLHYERLHPERDEDWATMLEADGLNQGFFMVLKGGNIPGIWAQQFAYGKEGTRALRSQLLIPGEEFRGSAQGHNNLFGMGKVIEPISVGGMGTPPHPPNSPSMHDVLKQATETGGIGGPAHGGTFGKASTVYLDAILGASEFVELANSHLYETGPWYDLLNCGVILPPVAGTDLPNFPYRETWQPFFGETRTYVRCDEPTSFESWKKGLRTGNSFVTTGPIIRMNVDRSAEGEVRVIAELASPLPLTQLEIILNGEPVDAPTSKTVDPMGVNRLTADFTFEPKNSCWLAARGEGAPKRTLWSKSGILMPSLAHTAAVPLLIDGNPISVPSSVTKVLGHLREQRSWYQENGKFESRESKKKMLNLFDEAIEKLAAGK